MKVTRSAQSTLKFANKGKLKLYHELLKEYQRVNNIFIDMFWENSFEKRDLTKTITNTPDSWLSARIRQCCAREALASCKASQAKAKEGKKKAIKPHHYGARMILSSQIVSVSETHGHFDYIVDFGSIGNKLKISLPIKSHRHMRRFQDWKRSSTVTCFKHSLQFSYTKNIPKNEANKQALGIDIGINKMMMTSEGNSFGSHTKPLLATIKRKQFKSKAYYRAKQSLKDYMHLEVKALFDAHPHAGMFVCEALKNMKQRMRTKKKLNKSFRSVLHNWNYAELLKIIQNHTEERGSFFRRVNPAYTSQTCPSQTCGHVERSNRVLEHFCCVMCGFTADSDHVGAANVVLRFTTGKYGSCFKPLLSGFSSELLENTIV